MILYIMGALVTLPGFQCVQLQPGYKCRGTAYGTVVLQDAVCRTPLHLLQGIRQVLLMWFPHTHSNILHDGLNHAFVAVCLNHDQATFEAEVHEDTGLVSLCSCGLNVCAPVQVSVISMPR